jgi:hypothetical protein
MKNDLVFFSIPASVLFCRKKKQTGPLTEGKIRDMF